MVHLLPTSPATLANSPTLQAWESSVRDNYAKYQHEIDKITFSLQKAQRGFLLFGQWLYPQFQHRDLQKLKLYRLKQQVGRIDQNEVDEYKVFNPNIASQLNQTFSTYWYVPGFLEFSFLAGLQVYAQAFNFAYSWRLGFLVVPYALKVFWIWGNNFSAKPSSEFLQWVIQQRTAKAQIERATLNTNLVAHTKKITESSNKALMDYYQDIVSLALQQQPNL